MSKRPNEYECPMANHISDSKKKFKCGFKDICNREKKGTYGECG